MTRRARSVGDSTIRDAVIAKRGHLAEGLGSSLPALEAAIEGQPLVLSTAALGGALARAGHPLWRDFTNAADPGGRRVWLLDAEDVLTELEPGT